VKCSKLYRNSIMYNATKTYLVVTINLHNVFFGGYIYGAMYVIISWAVNAKT